MATILVVDNELDILNLLRYNLEREQYRALTTDNGAEGLSIARQHSPDAIVLDIRMPGVDGYTVLKELRADPRTKMIPVLVLSAMSSLDDRLFGFCQGVDDYVGKPFHPQEILLRLGAILRRASSAKNYIRVGAFFLDHSTFRCFLLGKPLDLTATEYKILNCLLESAGRTLERTKLVDYVWGMQEENASRSLDTHIKRLREKLGLYRNSIKTVRSKGYRFMEPTGRKAVVEGDPK